MADRGPLNLSRWKSKLFNLRAGFKTLMKSNSNHAHNLKQDVIVLYFTSHRGLKSTDNLKRWGTYQVGNPKHHAEQGLTSLFREKPLLQTSNTKWVRSSQTSKWGTWRGFPNTTRTCSHKKYASRTSGTETVIGNSLKEVLADVLTKKNWKNQVRCFSSTQKGEKPQKSWLTAPPCGRLDLELKCTWPFFANFAIYIEIWLNIKVSACKNKQIGPLQSVFKDVILQND